MWWFQFHKLLFNWIPIKSIAITEATQHFTNVNPQYTLGSHLEFDPISILSVNAILNHK